MRKLTDSFMGTAEFVFELVFDLVVAFVIWIVLFSILDVAFPTEPNPDGSASDSWWTVVALIPAIAIAFLIRRRRGRSAKATHDEEKREQSPRSDPDLPVEDLADSAVTTLTRTDVRDFVPKSIRSLARDLSPVISQQAHAEWLPPGRSITVQGRQITDGMIYAGTGLTGISEYVEVEPALIDPSLPVDNHNPDQYGDDMSSWPSYNDISPASRAAYLDWLAEGRPGGAYIGYVFLFFYGIERRILFDRDREEVPDEEIDALVSEVERLLELYGEHISFNRYAGEFLSLARSLRLDLNDAPSWDPPLVRKGWELQLEVKLGLGSIVAAGEPVPPIWALSWLRQHPETSLRTPAVRCEQEFNELFQIRYEQQYGAGMMIRRNKTTLKHHYQAVNASFSSPIAISVDDLPDVSTLRRPVRNLRELAESVTKELESYSRWVGKHQDRDSVAALALLPTELIAERKTGTHQQLTTLIEAVLAQHDPSPVLASLLTEEFPTQQEGTMSAREASSFAQLLERLGYGLVPDYRHSKVNLSKHEYAVLFRLSDQHSEPSESYQAATLLLQLGAAVSAADGSISPDEERVLAAQLEESLQLSATDRTRLEAYLKWLLVEPPTMTGVRSRVEALPYTERKRVARFAITIAGADGSVSADETKVLTLVYNMLGLETVQLHRDIHELASNPSPGPVTVLRPLAPSGHQIPTQPPPENAEVVTLDREKIAAIMQDTKQVSDLLTEIFEGPAEPDPPEPEGADLDQDVEAASTAEIAGGLLDPAHAELVQFLAARPYWPRSEFEAVSNRLGLMPSGAVETINSAAFERCDEPLIEGDDPLEMNEFALKELLDG